MHSYKTLSRYLEGLGPGQYRSWGISFTFLPFPDSLAEKPEVWASLALKVIAGE